MAIRDIYQQIESQVWSQFPDEIKQMADRIKLLEQTNPQEAGSLLKQHPGILHARKIIALQKQSARRRS